MDTMEELAEAQREERRQIREDAEAFQAFMKHKAWPRYVTLIEAIAQNHYATAMKPIDTIDECVRTEFAKGVLRGLSLATAVPNMKIQEANSLRRPGDDE